MQAGAEVVELVVLDPTEQEDSAAELPEVL
jgi:hypothetical protein